MKMRTSSFFKIFMTPDLQKSSKNVKIFKKNFGTETTKKVLIYIQSSVPGSFGEFLADMMKMSTYRFLKNFMTPDLRKSSKNVKIFKKIVWTETTKKVLIYVPNVVSGSFGEF